MFRDKSDNRIASSVVHEHAVNINSSLTGPAGHRNKILRTIKEIKRQELEEDIPDEFLCPITREIMRDPAIAAGECIISKDMR